MRPKTRYRICLVAPPRWPHFRCFSEVALALKYSFESLGLDCDLTGNELAEDRMNILLEYHRLEDAAPLASFPYIVYRMVKLLAAVLGTQDCS